MSDNYGSWAMGIALYYLIIFFAIAFTLTAANDYTEDVSGTIYTIDTGGAESSGYNWYNAEYEASQGLGACDGSLTPYCSYLDGNENRDICADFPGCNFINLTKECNGTPFTEISTCSELNISMCLEVMGCVWQTESGDTVKIDTDGDTSFSLLSLIWDSLSLLFGFSFDIGLPGGYYWIIYPLFIWAPGLMLIIGLFKLVKS